MREIIRESVKEAGSLDQVRAGVIAVLVREKQKQGKVGYVSGIITSDGPEHIQENVKILEQRTREIAAREQMPVFSAVDVFDDDLFARLKAETLPQSAWQKFWREILGSGQVTDIFMTQRWQVSTGSKDEHEAAMGNNLAVHYEK